MTKQSHRKSSGLLRSLRSLAMTASVIKKFFIIPLLILPAIVACFVIGVDFASAKIPDDNVSGWAWSSTIGWISFNGDNVVGGTDYGVHICESDTDLNPYCAGVSAPKDGKIVGYAWSENIGWIKFSPDSSHIAQTDNNGVLTGWARACAGAANADCTGGTNPNSGGWDGWIKLAGTATDGSPYGTTIDFTPSPAEFHNHAWGSDVVGWVSFNCAEGGVAGGNICVKSNYKVTTTYSSKPKVTNLDIRQTPDYCTAGPSITVEWEFVGDSQSAYQVRIYEGNFATLVKDSGKVSLSSYSFSTIEGITYNKTYSWEVQVWNSKDQSSGWVRDTKTITTPAHQYPDIKMVGFSWLPQTPGLGETTQFTNGSNCYDINGPIECTWSWNIPNANYVAPSSSADRNPVVEFTMIGSAFSVSLTATDADNNFCTATDIIDVTLPFPEWREITPR